MTNVQLLPGGNMMRAALKLNTRMWTTLAVILALGATATEVGAQESVTVQISVKNHRFEPAEIRAPANKPIVLRVKNLDTTPMEFESVSLRVEKVVTAGSEGVINLRPLQPGQYNFFDDFHQQTAGVLIVQ
jgi:heme/copper-type cytochrome/quinol oxidase subunit 2